MGKVMGVLGAGKALVSQNKVKRPLSEKGEKGEGEEGY